MNLTDKLNEAINILDKTEEQLMFLSSSLQECVEMKFTLRDLFDKEKRDLIKHIIEKLESN